MSKERHINILLALVPFIALLRIVPIPEQCNSVIYISPEGEVYHRADQIYYVANSALLLILTWVIHLYKDSLFTGILLRLAFGKLFDEKISPFHPSGGELLWNIYIFIWALSKLYHHYFGDKRPLKLFLIPILLALSSSAHAQLQMVYAPTRCEIPSSIVGNTYVCIGFSSTLGDATPGGTWSSSATSVATIVSSTGLMTGIASGTSTITYSTGSGCTATTLVTVNPNPSSISGTTSACVGATSPLTDATAGGIWSSSSTSIATVGTSGIITGVASGTVTISYTLPTTCYATTTFTVNANPSAISGTLSVSSGSTTQLTDATAGGTWASASTSIATVGTAGLVTGVSAGTSTISYTLSTGCYATAVVTVTSSGSSAYTYLSTATGANTGGSTVVLTLNTTNAKLLVVYVGGLSGTMTIADNQSNIWTAVSEVHNGSQCVYGRIFYKLSPATSATHTVTVTGTSLGCAGVQGQDAMTIYAFNCTRTPVLDAVVTGQSFASAQTSITMTSTAPSVSDGLLLFGIATGNGGTPYTVSFSGMDGSNGTNNNPGTKKGSYLSYKLLTTSSAQSPIATMGGTNGYVGQGIFFK